MPICSFFGAIAGGVYLIIDTQLIIGDGRHAQFDIDDYIWGAMCLYLDILRIFLEIFLRIFTLIFFSTFYFLLSTLIERFFSET